MSRIGPREPGIVGLTPSRALTDLLWVANTRHGPGGHWFARVVDDTGDHDHLARGPAAVRYLADHKVTLPVGDVPEAALHSLEEIREMVRGLLEPARGWTPVVQSMLERTRFQVDIAGSLAAAEPGWAGFIGDLLIPLIQLVEIRDRLRICGNPLCRLIFLDLSRNKARQWCDNGGCGNRDRVRRYRSRQQAADPPSGYSPR